MRNALVPLFLCFLLILIGCSGGYSQGDSGARDDEFKTGVGSLEYSFLRNSPPLEVPQKQNSLVALELKNIGAYDIRGGYMTLSYDKAVVDFPESTSTSFSLRGKSADFPQGDTKVLTFPFTALPLATESQVRKTTIVASSCFDYNTQILEQVCIDTDPYDIKPDSERGICDQRDLSPGGTGGPVRVNRIETQFLLNDNSVSPKFLIHLSQSNHVQDKIFSPGQGNSFCTSQQFDADKLNKVTFKATLSDVDLNCDTDEIRLIRGEATVTCQAFPIDISLGNYEAPLFVELNYGVAKIQAHKFEIIR